MLPLPSGLLGKVSPSWYHSYGSLACSLKLGAHPEMNYLVCGFSDHPEQL